MIRILEYGVVRLLILLLGLFPYRSAVAFGRMLGRLAHVTCRSLRRRTMSNLRLAYGDRLSRPQAEAIARDAFDVLGRNIVEVAHMAHRADLGKDLEIVNASLLRDAYEGGKGVVLVSAHMGCFARMAAIPFLLGMKGASIMKKQKNWRLLDWARGFLKRRMDLDVILKPDAPQEMAEHFHHGSLVGFFADQHPRSGGVPAMFFDQPVLAAAGPAICARRYHAPMVVLTLDSRPDGTHTCIVDKVDTGGSVREVTQRWTSVIEARIREHPGQWMWMHRRWRGFDLAPAAT